MQLSEKQKAFSELFIAFLECTSNFKHFEKKKYDNYSSSISEVTDCENFRQTTFCKNHRFGTGINGQYVKVSQKLVKSS